MTAGGSAPRSGVPLAVKLLFTLWVTIWLPLYWRHYGPLNEVWLCDFANLVTLVAIWLESPVLLSSQLVAVAIPQIGWTLDWLGRLALGFHPIGGTEYMFDADKPVWLRGLSLFHLWMLPLLVWLVARVGYDKRGFWVQTALVAGLLLPLSRFAAPRADNVNWVWGPFGVEQHWMPPALWFALLFALYPLVLFLPPHWVAQKAAEKLATRRAAQREPVAAPPLVRSTARS
jgi:hypothetical protein